MSAKKVLKMLEKISDDKKKVHNVALAYCQDKCELVNSSLNLIYIKDGANIIFKNLEEFKPLFERVKAIEGSSQIIDEMFEINEDVEKIKSYMQKGYLVNADEIVAGKDSVIAEAKILCDNAKNYFLINETELGLFTKNFSVCRLRSFVEKGESGKAITQEDIYNIKTEIEKVRALINEERSISFAQIDKDIEGAKATKELLKRVSPEFYNQALLQRDQIDKIFEYFEMDTSYEKKGIIFYKFICQRVPMLLNDVRKKCKEIDLNFDSRLREAEAKLQEDEKNEILNVEKLFNSSKTGLLGGLINKNPNKMSKSDRNSKINEIKADFASRRSNLESTLKETIDSEKKKISENLDTVYKIDRILKENTVGYKFKVV